MPTMPRLDSLLTAQADVPLGSTFSGVVSVHHFGASGALPGAFIRCILVERPPPGVLGRNELLT